MIVHFTARLQKKGAGTELYEAIITMHTAQLPRVRRFGRKWYQVRQNTAQILIAGRSEATSASSNVSAGRR